MGIKWDLDKGEYQHLLKYDSKHDKFYGGFYGEVGKKIFTWRLSLLLCVGPM